MPRTGWVGLDGRHDLAWLRAAQVLRDAKGQPLVIAFDKFSRPPRGELMPIPAALRSRLRAARIEFQHTLKHDPCPSLALAQQEAKSMQAYVDCMKKHRVQVVNMGWGGAVGGVETALEECGLGGDTEARKKLARERFDIGRAALTCAMARAPDISFVAAAGKLLALKPTLTPTELIGLIAGTAERTADGRRALIHPKNALARVRN